MKIEKVEVDGIQLGKRLRQTSETAIAALAESMKLLGQLQPISIYSPDDATALLVTGYHRLEAARRLGWDYIEAVFVTGDEIVREMQEIAENLHRSDLTALERSEQIGRWAELLATKGTQVASPSGGVQPHDKGIKKVARDLGIDQDDASRSVKVAGLSSDAKAAARDRGLDDNRSALLAASRETDAQKQVEVLRGWRTRDNVVTPVEIPAPKGWDEVEAEQKRKLMQVWNGCSPAVKQWFREAELDKPIMDQRYA